jgi:outer membrane protein OmpA-like peptidoglycan-associated protein
MTSILSEVEEHATHEKGLIDGPSNPMAQHAYDSSVKTQSRSGLALGAVAAGLVLFLAVVSGLWLVSSVRRLNRQVARLNRQTEQLNHRLQGAEQQVKNLDQKASQSADAPVAPLVPAQLPAQAAAEAPHQTLDQVPPQAKATQAASPAPAQLPVQSKAAAPTPSTAAHKTEEYRQQRDAELQNLKQSLGQIAETRRTATGVVMTLGEKSIRFDSGKWNIAPQYRSILNRVAGSLMKLKGYSIYVYGFTDDPGTKDSNLQLSARRARAVRDALVKAGLDPTLISTKGFGKSKPLVRVSNPKSRAANRRVEIGIVDSALVSANQPISRN